MGFFKLLRPKQWTKNLLVFAPLIFAQQYDSPDKWLLAIGAFVAYSLTASSVYIINDILDIEVDRKHPVKQYRPIAAGIIKIPAAIVTGFLLFTLSLFLAYHIRLDFMLLLIGYATLMVLYSLLLKHIMLLDVFIVAIGLTLRAVAGAFAIHVWISQWLLVCTFFIALMLAMVKRRQELQRIGEDRDRGRISLREAPPLIVWDLWILMMSGITILAYTLYTMDSETVANVGSNKLLITVPFVVFAILRYHIAVYGVSKGEDPTETLLMDKSIMATVLGWLIVVLLVLNGII